ncbi:MAG: DUF1566 domain-containing protein [Rikenellaceae bacterium]
MKRVFIVALTMFSGAAMAQLTYPIVDTNQERFYNDSREILEPEKGEPFYGQDAHHVGNTPSYTDNGDGTITDNVTGLMWQKEFVVTSYDEAMKLAKEANTGGYNDWRVPTIKEGYSLILFSGVDASSANMDSVPEGAIPFIATDFFDFEYGSNGSRAIDTQMLSSTLFVGSSTREQLLFGVNLADGRIKGYPMVSRGSAKEYTVRLVRGAEYGVNKFVDNGNGTVSDLATGLMWQQGDSKKGLNWEEALEYAAKMNKKRYRGYNDWRVPNVKELQSLVDYTRSPESTDSAAIDPIFEISAITNEGGQKDFPFFWSSTTHLSPTVRNSASAADYVSFGRALGNMPQQMRSTNQRGRNAQMGQRQQGGQGQGQSLGQRAGAGAQQSPSQQNQRAGGASTATNWINIHGAGAQRSDPKSGDPSKYATGRGPQGDAIRIYNYVRLVRDIE